MKLKEYNDKIDVIIPAYNVPDKILSRCLASIAMQDCIDDVEVTIVDDASTEENYEAVIKNFEPMMKINLLRMEVNGGPGVARQYGLDHTSNGLITFIDSDDTFIDSYSLVILRKLIENNNAVMSIGSFEEIAKIGNDFAFELHEENYVWLFGKMFVRTFLEQNNIRFHKTSRANEDNGFLKICKFCATYHHKTIFTTQKPVYSWHFSENSITRANNQEYEFGVSTKDSFYGYIENMLYAIEYAKNHEMFMYFYDTTLEEFITEVMVNAFTHYIRTVDLKKENSDKTLEYCKWFFKEAYEEISDSIDKNELENKIFETLKNEFNLGTMRGVQPTITFEQFLDKLKGEVQ